MLARTPNLADPLSKTPVKVVAGELHIMPCGTKKLSSDAESACLCLKKTGNQRNKSDVFKLIIFSGGWGVVAFFFFFLFKKK